MPSPEAEDSRQLHRALEVLKEEKKRHRVRIQSLLFTQGIDVKVGPNFLTRLEQLRCWDQQPLPAQLRIVNSVSRAGGASKGSLSQANKSRYTNS